MDTLRICPQCREPLPTDATDRLCVRCQSDPGRGAHLPGVGTKAEPPTPAEIAQFFPQLEIIELLGYGGMGMVYKARQTQLNRFVALKILSPELSGDPAFAERFSREAQSLARLNHSNIVGVFDFGQTGGYYYLLMEFVDGATLHSLFHGVQVRADDARRIVIEICQALQFAHDEGVVHRDIKPSNILIDKKGRVKIADFGLAKLTGATAGDTQLAALTTAVMGTPHYIAPEQIETPGAVDHRADLYSLGVVYYEMLTGELPLGRFEAPSRRIEKGDTRLDEIVLRALEKDPDRRYQQAGEIRTAVEATATASQIQNTPPVPTPVPREARHWGFLRQFALMASAALVAVFFYVLFTNHWPWKQRNRPHPPQAAQMDFTGTSDAPLLGKRIVGALDLSKSQVQEVTRTVRRFERQFIVLERRHTRHNQDKKGRVHIIVEPFPGEMDQLLTNMWRDLGTILNDDQLARARTLNFERFFPNTGRTTVDVEVWRDASGDEHFVESENPGSNGAPAPAVTLPPGVPPRYRFYLPDKQP